MTVLLPTKIREDHVGAFRENSLVKDPSGQKREIVIIEAGWGSSGYYSEEVLERDIPKIFPVGTKMYLNHQTRKESMERPEGDLNYLVGKIIEAPKMSGIQAVSVALIYEHWVDFIEEMASDIGLSIRALGITEHGDAGGKHGQIVTALTEGISVDYVTEAGAGGKIGEIFESAKARSDVREALDSELRENLEKAGEERYGSKEPYTYCYVEDIEIDQNWVVYRVRVSGEDAAYYKVKFLRNGEGDVELQEGHTEVDREISWVAMSSDDTPLSEALEGKSDEDKENFIQEILLKEGYRVELTKEDSGSRGRPDKPIKEDEMSDVERRELEEKVRRLEDENKDLEEKAAQEKDRADRAEDKNRLNEAGKIAAKAVEKVEGLPRKARVRAIEAALRGDLPTHSDGKLDSDALKERATTKAKEELEYLGETSGSRVTGLGESLRPSGGGKKGDEPEGDGDELAEALGRIGMPEEAAAHAAEGR